MSGSSMMRWSPDREPDPIPIHGWDSRLDPSVKADITFREHDDREAALAWLESRTNLGEPEVEPERLRSVPFPPDNVRPPTTEWVREAMDYPRITAEEVRASMEEAERVRHLIAELPYGEITVRLGPPDFSTDGRETA